MYKEKYKGPLLKEKKPGSQNVDNKTALHENVLITDIDFIHESCSI